MGYWPKRFRESKQAQDQFIFITRRYWEWCLKPNEYFVIKEGAFGLGLFRITKNLKEFTENVNGKVVYVGYLALDILYKLSSTMQVRTHKDEQGWSGIMIGPLSFVNHHCDSTLHWTKFNSFKFNFLLSPEWIKDNKTYRRKPDSEFTDGRTWWKIRIGNVSNATLWNSKGEVRLNYGCVYFECACSSNTHPDKVTSMHWG